MAQQLVRWFCLLLLAGAAQAEPPRLKNQLAGHPSPYLALHGSDPVAWQEWNAETVARAKRENKLLFVSVGYYACHWCHVMQRESYKNRDIAELLNREFIRKQRSLFERQWGIRDFRKTAGMSVEE